MNRKLYGVGFGPGDPELMTMNAHGLFAGAAVEGDPVREGGARIDRSIAAEVIPAGARGICIEVPVDVARDPVRGARDTGAEAVGDAMPMTRWSLIKR